MKKWEYKTVSLRRITDMTEFNELGNEGWELINILSSQTVGGYRGIFKREIVE